MISDNLRNDKNNSNILSNNISDMLSDPKISNNKEFKNFIQFKIYIFTMNKIIFFIDNEDLDDKYSIMNTFRPVILTHKLFRLNYKNN